MTSRCSTSKSAQLSSECRVRQQELNKELNVSVPHIAGDSGYPNLNVESTEWEKEKKTKQMERLKSELDKQVKAKRDKRKREREESHRLDEIANEKAHHSLQEEEKRNQQKRETNKNFLRDNWRNEGRTINKRQQLLAGENAEQQEALSYRGLSTSN